MSELMYRMDEMTRKIAKEQAERESQPDPWGVVAEVALAFVLASILRLFCC